MPKIFAFLFLPWRHKPVLLSRKRSCCHCWAELQLGEGNPKARLRNGNVRGALPATAGTAGSAPSCPASTRASVANGLCLSYQVEPVSSLPNLPEVCCPLNRPLHCNNNNKTKGLQPNLKHRGLTDRLGTEGGAVSFGLFFYLFKPESASYTLPQQTAPSTVQEGTRGRGTVCSSVICGQKSLVHEP